MKKLKLDIKNISIDLLINFINIIFNGKIRFIFKDKR